MFIRETGNRPRRWTALFRIFALMDSREGGSQPSLLVRLRNLAGRLLIRLRRFLRQLFRLSIAWLIRCPRCLTWQPWTIFSPAGVLTVTAIPVVRVPGSIPSVTSGTEQSALWRSVSRTANRPCFQVLTALPCSSRVLALDGLVGETGIPSWSRTGTLVWLCCEMCLAKVDTPVLGCKPWLVWAGTGVTVRTAARRLAHAPEGILHLRDG